MMKKKIVLFGLNADPPHLGHLEVVFEIEKILGPEAHVIVMPTGIHPFNKHQDVDAKHRLALTRILFKELHHVEVDDYEIMSHKICYTYETLVYLKSKFHGAMIYFVMSTESAEHFFKWHKALEILCLANPVIVKRTGFDLSLPFKHKLQALCTPIYSDSHIKDVSSTSIRHLLKLNRSPQELTCDQLSYIKENNLYK